MANKMKKFADGGELPQDKTDRIAREENEDDKKLLKKTPNLENNPIINKIIKQYKTCKISSLFKIGKWYLIFFTM